MKKLMSKLFSQPKIISYQKKGLKSLSSYYFNCPYWNKANKIPILITIQKRNFVIKSENIQKNYKDMFLFEEQEIETSEKKKEYSDEDDELINYEKDLSIKDIENTDVEYKYLFKVRQKGKAGLNHLVHYLTNSKEEENLRDYLMLVCISNL